MKRIVLLVMVSCMASMAFAQKSKCSVYDVNRIVVFSNGEKINISDDEGTISTRTSNGVSSVVVKTKILNDTFIVEGINAETEDDNVSVYGRWKSGGKCDMNALVGDDYTCVYFKYYNNIGSRIEIIVYYDL